MKPLSEFRVGDFISPQMYPEAVWRISSIAKDFAMVREFHIITVVTGEGFHYWVGPIVLPITTIVFPAGDPEGPA